MNVRTSEHAEQAALFQWAALLEGRLPELATIFAIPNGGARHPAVAAKLRAEGVKAGVWDAFLATPRGGLHGLWIEMKVERNGLTPAQMVWRLTMEASGYRCVVCYSWCEAARAICAYLGVAPEEYGL